MTADLNSTKSELSSLKGHIKDIDKQEVTNEMDSIAYEERIDEYKVKIESLNGDINKLVAEKTDLKSKLDRYISENMELLEKIDKLSKGSSVESMEILERLTQEEKLEMERFQHAVEAERQRYRTGSETIAEDNDASKAKETEGDQTDESVSKSKLNESEAEKSNDECVEGKSSSIDHEEILSKLKSLQEENNQLIQSIDELRAEKQRILDECEEIKTNNLEMVNNLQDVETDRQNLLDNIKEINDIKTSLENETQQLKTERDSLLANKQKSQTEKRLHFIDADAYKTGLKSLTTELDNYRNAKEKNAKVNASKKLARESKNIAELMEALLTSYNSCAEQFDTFKAEIDGERVAREEHDKQQLDLMSKDDLDDKNNEIKELNERLSRLQKSESEYKQKCADFEQQIEENITSYSALER